MRVLWLALALVLSSCSVKSDAPRPTLEVWIPGPNEHLVVSEICYDGITYLITPKGGITPKMVNAAAPFNDTSSAARVAICK